MYTKYRFVSRRGKMFQGLFASILKWIFLPFLEGEIKISFDFKHLKEIYSLPTKLKKISRTKLLEHIIKIIFI